VRRLKKALSSTFMSRKGGGGVAFDRRKIAEKPPGEVDQVHALVDQFAAAGEGGIGAPLTVVALAAAVAVAGAEEHKRAEGAGFEEFAGFLEGGVETVIIADADAGAGLGGGLLNGAELGCVEGAGFFNEDVFAGFDRGERDRGEGGVERGDDDGVDGGIGEDGGVVGRGSAAGDELGEAGGASGVEVAGGVEGDAPGIFSSASARLRPMRPQPIMAKPVGRDGEALDVDIDLCRLGRELRRCRVWAGLWHWNL